MHSRDEEKFAAKLTRLAGEMANPAELVEKSLKLSRPVMVRLPAGVYGRFEESRGNTGADR